LAAWAGIRPLVLNPNKKDTQSIARNHIIHVSDSGLVTIGGKKIIYSNIRQVCSLSLGREPERSARKRKSFYDDNR